MPNYENSKGGKRMMQKIKQKLLGVGSLLIVIAEWAMSNANLIDEGGAFIIMLPLGLYLLFTKEKVIM